LVFSFNVRAAYTIVFEKNTLIKKLERNYNRIWNMGIFNIESSVLTNCDERSTYSLGGEEAEDDESH